MGKRFIYAAMASILLAALLVTVMPAPSASAQLPIDDETVVLINAHRASKGLNPLIKDPVLTQAAIDWSAIMQGGSVSTSSCGLTPGGALDPGAAFGSPDPSPTVPDGASHIADFVNYTCTPQTTTARFAWADPVGLPSYCSNSLSQASAEYLTCWLLSYPSQRNALEDDSQTHIGLGVGSKGATLDDDAYELYSTLRLAGNVPLPLPPAPQAYAPAIPYTGPFTNAPAPQEPAYGFGGVAAVGGTPISAITIAVQSGIGGEVPASPGLAATGTTSGATFSIGMLFVGLGAWAIASSRVVRASGRLGRDD